jgi:hypothetical protein
MNKRSRKHLQEVLNKNPSCYVLITCGQPSEDGEMQVEMTYQGDAALASYLLHGAQLYIDPEDEQQDLLSM